MRYLALAICLSMACFDLGAPAGPGICGNGIIEEGEECDLELNCAGDCTLLDPVCGNGIVEEGEECDLTANCDTDCTLLADPISCEKSVMPAAALAFCNEVLLENVDPADCQITSNSPPEDFCNVSFQDHIMPIVTNSTSCGMGGCHLNGQGNFTVSPDDAPLTLINLLDPSAALKGSADPLDRLEPSDPERSYLIHKLLGTQGNVGGFGPRMPFGQDPLCPEEIATICFWTAAGALDN